jgi:hypothetical protein
MNVTKKFKICVELLYARRILASKVEAAKRILFMKT